MRMGVWEPGPEASAGVGNRGGRASRSFSMVSSMFLVDSVLRKEQASNVAFNGSASADIGLFQPAASTALKPAATWRRADDARSVQTEANRPTANAACTILP